MTVVFCEFSVPVVAYCRGAQQYINCMFLTPNNTQSCGCCCWVWGRCSCCVVMTAVCVLSWHQFECLLVVMTTVLSLKLLPWEHTDAVSVAVSRRLLRRVVMRRKMKLNKTTRKMTLLPQFLVEDIAMRCLPTALEWVSRHSLFCIVYFRGGSAADLQDLFRRIEWIKEGWDPVSVESMLWVPFTATTLLSQWQKTNSDQLNKQ